MTKLPMEYARCMDNECPSRKECDRYEPHLGLGRYCWLPICTRKANAKKCRLFITAPTECAGQGDE